MFPGPPIGTVRLNNSDDDLNDLGSSWEERHRRARSVRLLVMFLTMLLLMDGDPKSREIRRHNKSSKKKSNFNGDVLDPENSSLGSGVGETSVSSQWRMQQFYRIQSALKNHPRLAQLSKMNVELLKSEQEESYGKDQNTPNSYLTSQKRHYYYPNNATGHYRGSWTRLPLSATSKLNATYNDERSPHSTPDLQVQQALLSNNESIALLLLPEGVLLRNPLSTSDSSLLGTSKTDATWMNETSGHNTTGGAVHPLTKFAPEFLKIENATTEPVENTHNIPNESYHLLQQQAIPKIQIKSDSGRVLMQLSLHTVPDMKGVLSVVDGYIKLFDSESGGMFMTTASQSQSVLNSLHKNNPSTIESRHQQPKTSASSRASHTVSSSGVLTIKVKGVMLPPIGRVSMVGNAPSGRSVLVIRGANQQSSTASSIETEINNESTHTSQIQHAFNQKDSGDQENDFSSATGNEEKQNSSTEQIRRHLQQQRTYEASFWSIFCKNITCTFMQFKTWIAGSVSFFQHYSAGYGFDPRNIWLQYHDLNLIWRHEWQNKANNEDAAVLQNAMINKTSVLRQLQNVDFGFNELNSIVSPLWLEMGSTKFQKSDCEFEINLDVDPLLFDEWGKNDSTDNLKKGQKQSAQRKEQQQLVGSVSGTIVSPNCDFAAHLSTVAVRVNWASITSKAINYSFTMMLLCLAQIVLLLRQLLHSQSNFLASRVSMLTIGWQCILDAIWCMVHILFCLVMQPLFTAFASVAFFKLLMFCVIEMKYLQIIEQARMASVGQHVTSERMRRQAAIIQCWFYVGLISVITLYWKLRHHWSFVVVFLHSWWVPQIIKNVITETKQPCHSYYVFGMSATRVMAPIYIFGFEHNFIREMNPEFPQNAIVCYALIIWVGLQAVVLHLQGKLGARFMIPARFLPPRFDYSRPIPESMLHSPTSRQTISTSDIESGSSILSSRGIGSRNRISGSSSRHRSATTVDEPTSTSGPSLDCVICCSSVDVHNRRAYMLPPCDHIFHRQCLEQWMEVKLECPICRKALPPI